MTDDGENPHRSESGDGDAGAGTTGDEGAAGTPKGDAPEEDSEQETTAEETWFSRLESYRSELASTTAPDRRAEIIEKIRQVEDGLVEEGYLSEDERGDYDVDPTQAATDGTTGEGPNGSDVDSGDSSGLTGEDESERETGKDTREGVSIDIETPDETSTDTDSGTEEGTATGGENQSGTSSTPDPSRSKEGQTDTDEDSAREGSAETRDRNGETNEPEGPEAGSSVPANEGTATGDPDVSASEQTASTSAPEAESHSAEATGDREQPEPSGSGESEGESSATGSPDATREVDGPEEGTGETGGAHPDAGAEEETATASKPAVTREEVAELSASVEAIESRVDELEDLFSEFKRANEHEHAEIRKYSTEEFAENMLRVRDTLQRAIEFFDWEGDKRSRMEAIIDQFDQQFTAREIDVIEPEPGVPFEFGEHEVVGREPAPDHDKDEILRVQRRGFELSGRVIRPAQVVVASEE
ncbi:MAG: nucleotide exchange factor GrpE [Halodesulfurarchaeum sp.]